MLASTRYVERHGGKIRNLAVACLLSAAALVAPLFVPGFWTIPPRFLSGMGAAAGLAFINSVGMMGGFVSPTMMGWLTDRTGSFDTGLAAMAGVLMISTGLAWSLRGFVKNE
jgi:nitrate/nitrite transporter NarK